MATNKKKYFEIWIDFYTLDMAKNDFKLGASFDCLKDEELFTTPGFGRVNGKKF